MSDRAAEAWKQIAIALGDQVYQKVNSPQMVGTDDDTGYILMFFNVKKHNGKSTLVALDIDRASLKRLLKGALRALDSAVVVEQGRHH